MEWLYNIVVNLHTVYTERKSKLRREQTGSHISTAINATTKLAYTTTTV